MLFIAIFKCADEMFLMFLKSRRTMECAVFPGSGARLRHHLDFLNSILKLNKYFSGEFNKTSKDFAKKQLNFSSVFV